MFHVIDVDSWKRKEWFLHYTKEVPCTYSSTSDLDITNIKKKNYGIYPSILFALSKTVSEMEQFRMGLNAEGKFGYYDMLSPSYTIFNETSKTFTVTWTQYDGNFSAFCERYKRDSSAAKSRDKFLAKPPREDCFSVTMDPWTRFTGFNLNLKNDYSYFLPIFTAGRYERVGERFIMPLSVQVHHAVCDGYHVGMFLKSLQKNLDQL